MLKNGYVKIYRSMLDWEWYGDINTSRLFLHLLLVANHEEEKWRGMTVQRGQRVTSRANLARETGLTEDEIRTALKHLQNTHEITSKTTNKYTVITIINYDRYQAEPQQIPSKRPVKSPSIPQPFPTKEESKKARSNIVLTDNIDASPEWEGFVAMRARIKKPLTDRAKAMALSKLEKLAPGDTELKKKILAQSEYHAWQDLYPLKTDAAKEATCNEPKQLPGAVRL